MTQEKPTDRNNTYLWDDIWSDSGKDKNRNEFNEWVKRDSSGVRGTKAQKYISENLGEFQRLKTIEVGSGLGTFSYIFSRAGATVTLLDSSRRAINAAKEIYDQTHVNADFLVGDAFSLDENLYGKYDIAMSFGTVEHFRYPKRLEIMKAHTKLVRKGGVVIISVPNKAFLPHEILKVYLCARNKWKLGYEGEFTRGELSRAAKVLGLNNVEIIGSAFLSDFQRYLRIYRSTSLAIKYLGEAKERPSIRERASPLDDLFGADIVLMGVKKQ